MSMTNNDEIALKLKSAAEKATSGEWRYLKTTPFMDAEISASNNTRVINFLSGDVTEANSAFIAEANPANILSLLAERDADKNQIEQLIADRMNILKTMGVYVHAYEEAKSRIAELEARTVSVKLPEPIGPEAAPAHYWDNGESMAYADGYNKATSDAKNLCAAAGINLEVRE